jgi:hydrogenase nickel incorporation protein HypB
MCSTCGCGRPDEHTHDHDHGSGAHGNVIRVERDLLAENERYAAYNRGFFDGQRIRCLNLISAPGSGKTTLLERSLEALLARGVRCSVIEGDQHTDRDARRIARTGAPVHQIETGKACHLDAHQVQHALDHLAPQPRSLLFIENVGNLICPTEFNLGEHERVAMLSVTEGSDKPAKYPLAFRTAHTVVIGKIDLLPHVEFDLEETERLVRGLNPAARIFRLSARTGEGMDAWIGWLAESVPNP